LSPRSATHMDELFRLGAQVQSLAGPWLAELGLCGPGRQGVSLSALEGLITSRSQARRELALVVQRHQEALNSGRRRLAAGLEHASADQAQRVRQALHAVAAQLGDHRAALAQADRELASLQKLTEFYVVLLAEARRVLAVETSGQKLPQAAPLLARARGELEQAERVRQVLLRLARVWEQTQQRLGVTRQEGRRLCQQNDQLKQELGRLEPAEARSLDDPARQLRAGLDEQAQRLGRDLEHSRRCRRAWQRAATGREEFLAQATKRLNQAQEAVLAARQRAAALQKAAASVSEALGGLRPQELDPEVAALALQAWELELPLLRLEKLGQTLSASLAQTLPSPVLPQPPAEDPFDRQLLAGAQPARDPASRQQRAGEPKPSEGHAAPELPPEPEQRGSHPLEKLLEQTGERNLRLGRRLARSLERQHGLRREQRRSQKELAQARAGQSSQSAENQRLAAELGQARREVERWQGLARSLSLSLGLTGQAAGQENQNLSQEVAGLKSQVATLQKQLLELSTLVALTARAPAASRPAALRLIALGRDQVEGTMGRLAATGRRLRSAGRGHLAQWALIAGLTSGMVLMPQSNAPEATLRDVAGHPYTLDLKAEFGGPAPSAALDLHLLPLNHASPRAALRADPSWQKLAESAGVSPEALYVSARSHYPQRGALEAGQALKLAGKARGLAVRHPLIHRDMAKYGMPQGYLALLGLRPPAETATNRFVDRLYREYRRLGYQPQRALKAVVANERASAKLLEAWRLPRLYRGWLKPLPLVEKMGLEEFLQKISPFIAGRAQRFYKHMGKPAPKDISRYAKDLAFDIYCAAKKFKVPVSFLLAVAHQESWYANVLGDQNRSASPFQIFGPTVPYITRSMKNAGFAPPPASIRLQHHLSMATYMAAYHLRFLMEKSYRPPRAGRRAAVDMDRVLHRYNGASTYAAKVALRRGELARFLGRKG
jgi:hypothetical protein